MSSTHSLNNKKIAVIGLGYVGLPLAVEFAKKRDVVGFDVNASRIEALRAGHDSTFEVSDKEMRAANRLRFTCDLSDLADCNVYIVTVPTPIDAQKRPDLTHLMSRATLAAGAADNTPENLRSWIHDPNTLKPGALMPAMQLNDQETDEVVAYLETLH